jgi:uncharacterized protein (DUF433 family)
MPTFSSRTAAKLVFEPISLREVSMSKEYIEQYRGAYRVAGTRVSLDSIVYAFWKGQSPESIVQSFPVLKLEEVYGAIAFYLANREKIDAYIKEGEAEFEKLRQASREANADLYKKLEEARKIQTSR